MSRARTTDQRGRWALVMANGYDHGPDVVFLDDPRRVIGLLTRWARSRCCNESLEVWQRSGARWEPLAP